MTTAAPILPNHAYFLYKYPDYTASSIVADLVDVFTQIYIADITTDRPTDQRRLLVTSVEVSNPDYWLTLTPSLARLVAFVSGDDLSITFTARLAHSGCFSNTPLFTPQDISPINSVTLLSGGLDSFCGANYNIQNNIETCYISYKNTNREISSQKKVAAFLSALLQSLIPHLIFPRVDIKKRELSQRTRCLLYLSLGVLACDVMGASIVRVYENGILSLNPGFGRRFTTKSTHPKTFYLYNKILESLRIPVLIENPYFFLTKGEMVSKLSSDFLDNINLTTTCGSSMQNPHRHSGQCGFCIPCILRKISLASAGLENYDTNYQIPYETKPLDIDTSYIRNEYRSSLNYFIAFQNKVTDKSVWSHLDLHTRYFAGNAEYYLKLERLLNQFCTEIEEYMRKYELR